MWTSVRPCLQGIILAFAGKVLLQRTNFTLERGGTYGIVGQNGTGKTTLLNRIAAKDITGRGLHSSTFRLDIGAVSGIGGECGGCLWVFSRC